MQKLSIRGGTPLTGEVRVAGAKNAALPVLASALLASGPLRVVNLPELKDVSTMVALLKRMGVSASAGPGTVQLDARGLTEPVIERYLHAHLSEQPDHGAHVPQVWRVGQRERLGCEQRRAHERERRVLRPGDAGFAGKRRASADDELIHPPLPRG